MIPSKTVIAVAIGSVIAAFAPPALALSQRTFVASYGNDANPCSLALPCRGFAAAIAKTNPGGEVIVKDSAGYGTVTINQSVSIIAPAGVYAGITVAGLPPGVTVNAPGGKVLLRGLNINGATGAQYGIWLQAGAELAIDRCVVANAHDAGVYSTASGSALTITDSLIRNTVFGRAVWVAADTRAVLERVRLLRSQSSLGQGVFSDESANTTIKDSIIAANVSHGVLFNAGPGATTNGTVDNALISDNALGDGVRVIAHVAGGGAARASVMRSTMTRNGGALLASANPPGTAYASAVGNLVTHHNAAFRATGTGQALSARDNTFAGTVSAALISDATSVLHTVRGADGLPSNAGEEAATTSGNVVPVNAF
jgi:hypothetical protein